MPERTAATPLATPLAAVLALHQQTREARVEGVLALTADASIRATLSRLGFAHEVGDLVAPTAVWRPGGGVGSSHRVDPELLASVLRNGAAVVRNVPPPGHGRGAALGRHVVVPVLDGERVVALLGVAGRPADYAPEQVELLGLLGAVGWREVLHRRLVAALEAVEDRLSVVAGAESDGILILDRAGRIQYGNDAAGRMIGLLGFGLVGRALAEFVEPDEQARRQLKAAARERVGPFELTLLRPDGAVRIARATAGPWRDHAGRVRGTWASLHDSTEELAELEQVMSQREVLIDAQAQVIILNEELRRSARTDPLTTLGNRLRLAEDVVELQAENPGQPTAVAALMIDIDFFKRFNDRYGHLAGDATLQSVAGAVRGALRATDNVYRYGGEEILALLPGAPASAARNAAERVLQAVAGLGIAHLDNPPAEVVTVSIGVAVFDVAHTTLELALREADAALYAAKELGRNCWVALAA